MELQSIIQAQPGYFLLIPSWDGKAIEEVYAEPIIAFFVDYTANEDVFDGCFGVVPIIAGSTEIPKDYAVQFPDGRCCICEDRDFASRDELLAHWRETLSKP